MCLGCGVGFIVVIGGGVICDEEFVLLVGILVLGEVLVGVIVCGMVVVLEVLVGVFLFVGIMNVVIRSVLFIRSWMISLVGDVRKFEVMLMRFISFYRNSRLMIR